LPFRIEKANKKSDKGVFVGLFSGLYGQKGRFDGQRAAAVFNYVSKVLIESLPDPAYQTDDIDLKTNLVYAHLKQRYLGKMMPCRILSYL